MLDYYPEVVARAAKKLVTDIIIPADDRLSWDQIAGFESVSHLHPAYGIHPWRAHEYPVASVREHILAELRAWLTDNRAVAIGEIGLDSKSTFSTLEEQIPLCEAQLELALEMDQPVILHCRSAFDTLLSLLANANFNVRGVLHAFTRGPELGQRLIDAGLHLGFGGHITRPEAKRARLAAAALPLERLVLETDAPNIGLAGVAAPDVEPAHIPRIGQVMAELRNVPLETVAGITTANARGLFHFPEPESKS